MAAGATPTNDARGREEDPLVKDPPPSSSTKSRGKAIQAYDEEHNEAASSTKLIPKANADCTTHTDMDDPLESAPFPKKSQPPEILAPVNDMRDHSPSRDEGPELNSRASKYGHDDYTQTGESSTNRSTGVGREGITSPRAAELAKGTVAKTKSLGKAVQNDITSPSAVELAKGTAAASSFMKTISRVDPKTEGNVNSPSKMSSSTLGPMKTVRDTPGSEEHTLAVGQPPTSGTKSQGKAIEVEPASDEEHDGEASSTKIIPKANAEAGPSVRAPAQHDDEVAAAIEGPPHPNASDSVASTAAPAVPVVAQQDVNAPAIAANGGGPPAPAQINDGGDIAARPAPAQPNAGGPAPNAARPVAVLPPNPGVNYIDEVLMNSGIRALRNPADGDEGKLWDQY